jgi:heptosyltransferase-2
MVQALKRTFPEGFISFVAIPVSAAVLLNHPSLDEVIEYDKKGTERGLRGMLRCAARLREGRFDTAIIPHRSIRSAFLPFLAGIPQRIGFSTSAGSFMLTEKVRDDRNRHEILRNLDLLRPLGIEGALELPSLYPSADDRATVDRILAEGLPALHSGSRLISVAPGSVWETKRWPEAKFAALTRRLTEDGFCVAVIGGPLDESLAERVASAGARGRTLSTAGRLSMLQSAEVIRRSEVLVTNDSAPMHAGVAMQTPVVALFGATIPGFGFGPVGSKDRIHQTDGLRCRPCSIHGGKRCPIGTFDCMQRIDPMDVAGTVEDILKTKSQPGSKLK